MDSGWQPYQDPLMGRPAQFNPGLASHPQQLASKYGQPPQSQPPVGYTYETFQTPNTATKTPSTGPNPKPVSMDSSPTATPRTRDYVTDADTNMEDADPYNRAKYPSRPNNHSRPSSQFLSQTEESSAARRYSPMNVLSPPMSYPTSPGKSQSSYGFPATPSGQSRRSPRTTDYSSPPLGYQSPPCKFSSTLPNLAIILTISGSKPPPSTSSSPGSRSQPRTVLPPLRILPHESFVWSRRAVSPIGLVAIPGPRSWACAQVPENQVCARTPTPSSCAACLPTRQPGRRLHQRKLSLVSVPLPRR